MRRRPVEDERKEEDRRKGEITRHRRPADHWRQRASGAADHDVLRRGALQDQRIDQHVEAEREEREEGGHRSGGERQEEEARKAEQRREAQRRANTDRPRNEWATRSARHARVNVNVNDAVEDVRARCT